MIKTLLFLLTSAVAVYPLATAAESFGDAEKGAKVFRKCKACHQVGPDAKHKVGPALENIVNAPIAKGEGFKYSDALRALGADGRIWDTENLDAFLKKPKDFAKGTKMSFAGLKKEKDRANLIAFLASHTASAVDESPEFAVAPEVLALEGDLEYGEYLASECTTCHRADGSSEGMPVIVGWPKEDFVTAMHAYREKHRENPVMQMVSGRLSNDEIAALAAYFNSLGE